MSDILKAAMIPSEPLFGNNPLKTADAEIARLRAALAEAERCNADQYREHMACISEQKARAERAEADLAAAREDLSAILDEAQEVQDRAETVNADFAAALETMKQIGYASIQGCDFRTTVLWFQAIARAFLERTAAAARLASLED